MKAPSGVEFCYDALGQEIISVSIYMYNEKCIILHAGHMKVS